LKKLFNLCALVYVAFALICTGIYAQKNNLIFEKINTENGLSQNRLTSIYQDSRGLLWFGTQDGLNMYDGYKFKVFKHEPGNPNSLSDYAVNTIFESDSGIFWIGTREGLNRFDLKMESFKIYKHNPDSSNSLVYNLIWHITQDRKGNLWIGTRNGLSKFNPSSEIFTNYHHDPDDPNSLSHNFVPAILEDPEGILWIGTRGGLDRYDETKEKFYNHKIDSINPNNILKNGVLSIEIVKENLWVGTYTGLYSFDLAQEVKTFTTLIDFYPHHVPVKKIVPTEDNLVWVSTFGDGLIRYSLQNNTLVKFNSSEDHLSLSENLLSTVIQDFSGVLWIGTYSKGLNKHNRASERFITYRVKQNSTSTQHKAMISTILEDKRGDLWIGTEYGGLIRINALLKKNESFTYLHEDAKFRDVIGKTEITSMLEDSYGMIWVSSFGSGVYIIDPVKNELTHLIQQKGNKNSLSNNYVHTVYEDKHGIIWIGTGAGGLNKYNRYTKEFKVYRWDPEDSTSISSLEATSVCEDEKGNLWVGTSTGGVNKYLRKKDRFEHFNHDVTNMSSISSNRVICMMKDSKGRLWFGTFGGGLNLWNDEYRSFVHYGIQNGFPSNLINTIVEDKFGNIWVSTDKGIARFNPDTKKIKTYDINDGLQGNEFYSNSGYANNKTGRIYFGGASGFNVFNSEDMVDNETAAPIVFTDFRIYNKPVPVSSGEEDDSPLKESILFAKELIIPFSDNYISFEFAALDYNNPEKIQYAYMMEGFNKDWIYSGNQRFATFTNLDAGDYAFKVKSTNSDGIWNEEGTSIKVIILPPWWQTWWAYLIYAAAIISILFFARQFEMKRVKLRNQLQLKDVEAKKLQEVDKLKSRFFANISHEFRTPLTLILGLTNKLSVKNSDVDSKKDHSVIKKNANRLLQLINQLLELSKLEAGSTKIQASKTDLIKFLRRILSSFSSLADQKNIEIVFNGSLLRNQSEQKEIFLYLDIEKFETVIYNLVSNGIKFSPAGEKLEVEVTPHLQSVDIRITNTGVGIPKEKLSFVFDRFYQVDESLRRDHEGTGIGLALVKEIVDLHNGEIKVFSEEEKTTTFLIRLNVGRAHFEPDEVSDSIVEIDDPATVPGELDEELATEEVIPEKVLKSIDKREAKIILLVEDNFDLRNYISEQLEDDFTIFEAEDGEKGVEMAGEMIPDLIVSDIMMPKMDGYGLCKKIKSDFKTSHIPIILLTAKAAREDKIEGLELGADDYLVKPFDPDELKLKVQNLIKSREQLREKLHIELLQKPKEVSVPSTERVFLENINSTIEKNIDKEEFGVDELSKVIGLSRSQLHRKIKAISGQSTTEFIRNFRLHRAADLLKQDAGNIAEIAYKVGFGSQAYFTKSFQELFNCSPSEYKKSKQDSS
jgi:signal transduction histidine kinase/ligand-binding sensor domain-containing protein/DNA-binding response OmpR family regulator